MGQQRKHQVADRLGRRSWLWALAAAAVACADTGGDVAVIRVPVADAGASTNEELDGGTSDTDSDAASEGASTEDAATDTSPDDGSVVDQDQDAASAESKDAGTLASYAGCLPGVYFGTFSGQVGFLPGLFGSLSSRAIQGNVTIRVSLASAGTLLVVDNGVLKGNDQDGNPLSAMVSGVVDCQNGLLRSGKLTDGHYLRGDTDLPFTGDVTANYTAGSPPTISGTWTATGGLDSGSGVFSAVLRAQ